MEDVQKDTITAQMAEVHTALDGEAPFELDASSLEVADRPVEVERQFIQTADEIGEHALEDMNTPVVM